MRVDSGERVERKDGVKGWSEKRVLGGERESRGDI